MQILTLPGASWIASRCGTGVSTAIGVDGLVNLFDIGMILAVAFLIAGLTLTLNAQSKRVEWRTADARPGHVIPSPAAAPSARGRGKPVGQVYRLADGRLVFVKQP